jgi:hypothetical protein
VATALLASLTATPAHANARITGLTDVNFGTINVFADTPIAQNVCVYSVLGGTTTRRPYSVRATGSGTGGAFTLASGARTLPYEVRWDDTRNQTTGTQLTAGVDSSGYVTGNVSQTCTAGANENASLIITITGTSLASATAGTYTGVLTILITPN